mgnify:CR=1 FL=1
MPDEVQKLVDDNSKKELIALAEILQIEDVSGNKTELATLIFEKQNQKND